MALNNTNNNMFPISNINVYSITALFANNRSYSGHSASQVNPMATHPVSHISSFVMLVTRSPRKYASEKVHL